MAKMPSNLPTSAETLAYLKRIFRHLLCRAKGLGRQDKSIPANHEISSQDKSILSNRDHSSQEIIMTPETLLRPSTPLRKSEHKTKTADGEHSPKPQSKDLSPTQSPVTSTPTRNSTEKPKTMMRIDTPDAIELQGSEVPPDYPPVPQVPTDYISGAPPKIQLPNLGAGHLIDPDMMEKEVFHPVSEETSLPSTPLPVMTATSGPLEDAPHC